MSITVQTNFAGIRTVLLDWLQTYSGLAAGRAIWRNDSLAAPSLPYGTLWIKRSARSAGQDEHREEFNSGTSRIERTTLGPRQMEVEAQVVTASPASPSDPDPVVMLETALACLQTESLQGAFAVAQLGFLEHTAIDAVEEQVASVWLRRATASLTFIYTSKVLDDDANWIETVEAPSISNGNLIVNE